MSIICDLFDQVVNDHKNEDVIQSVKNAVQELCDAFPLYSDLSH